MLNISDATWAAFQHQSRHRLVPRIDAWLIDVVSAWKTAAPAVRQNELGRMVALATESRMEVERDYAVFAWVCVMLGPDWHQRLADPEIRDRLLSTEFTPEAKLMALDEMFGLAAAPR